MNEAQKSAMTESQDIECIALKSALIDTLIFNEQHFYVRAEDCYWDATRMCQAYGKRINNFLRSENTQRYLNALSKKTGIPVELDPKSAMTETQEVESIALGRALIYKSKGGDVSESGTWVHQQVALKLAAWLNEDFEVWVWEVIEKLLTQGYVRLEDELESLRQALHLQEEQYNRLAIDHALLEHKSDRDQYLIDELQRDMEWHRSNSWGGRDR